MNKVEWATSDSRIEFETMRDGDVAVTVVYERDAYQTDSATVYISKREFMSLLVQAQRTL